MNRHDIERHGAPLRRVAIASSLALLSLVVPAMTLAAETPPTASAPATTWDANKIIGSKHDLTKLNTRGGVEAMANVAFSDYGNPCIYCHVPPEREESAARPGQVLGWNRLRTPEKEYSFYTSNTFDSKQEKPGEVTMLCLSCHDGTMAVDRIVHQPVGWSSNEETALHMRLSDRDDLTSCGKCHDGKVAHNISAAAIGTRLTDDHPVAIKYAGFNLDKPGFKSVDNNLGFKNGVRLYQGNIECATCHDVHNPDARMLLRVTTEVLCSTCHTN